MASGAGDLDDHDPVAAAFHDAHILFGKNIGAHPGPVVQNGPEFPDQPFRRREGNGDEAFVSVLRHAKKENAAEGVRKGGIGLPDAVRKAALGFFCFDPVVFPVDFQIGKIKHIFPPFLYHCSCAFRYWEGDWPKCFLKSLLKW